MTLINIRNARIVALSWSTRKKLTFPSRKTSDRRVRRVNRPSWVKFLEQPRFREKESRPVENGQKPDATTKRRSFGLSQGNVRWSIVALNRRESRGDPVERAATKRGKSNFSNWFDLNWRRVPPSVEIVRFARPTTPRSFFYFPPCSANFLPLVDRLHRSTSHRSLPPTSPPATSGRKYRGNFIEASFSSGSKATTCSRLLTSPLRVVEFCGSIDSNSL